MALRMTFDRRGIEGRTAARLFDLGLGGPQRAGRRCYGPPKRWTRAKRTMPSLFSIR